MPEGELLGRLLELIKLFQDAKPAERSEIARRYAVTITELEKAAAYFASFVVGDLLAEKRQEEG